MATPVIKKLEAITINRIAAGEVIQRPCNAAKEMVENSLDAGAKSIILTAKGGGIDMLQIQDTGHGIRKEDLNIVCERFTTSKISTFDDLKKVTTFGFRGEALASITHVANVTILTKTIDSPCAYKAKYCDGKLAPYGPGKPAEPQACAGTVGTTITVEDLYHNMHTRRLAFKNTNEEYRKLLSIITKYAVHFADKGVAFTCRKHGQSVPDLHVPASADTLETIKIVYGSHISRELLKMKGSFGEVDTHSMEADRYAPISVNSSSNSGDDGGGDGGGDDGDGDGNEVDSGEQALIFHVEGWISNANFSAKKGVYIFFINNRLVECSALRRIVDVIYAEVLPKHAHPFVYLSLRMPPEHVDVNVHPTKKDVHFLHEDKFLEQMHSELRSRLAAANQSRTFYSSHFLSSSVDGLLAVAPMSQMDPTSNANGSLRAAVTDVRKKHGDNSDDDIEDDTDHGNDHGGNMMIAEPSKSEVSVQNDDNKTMDVDFDMNNYINTDANVDIDALKNKRKRQQLLDNSEPTTNIQRVRKQSQSSSSASATSRSDNKLVRTDASLAKIDHFYRREVPLIQSQTQTERNTGSNNGQAWSMTDSLICGECGVTVDSINSKAETGDKTLQDVLGEKDTSNKLGAFASGLCPCCIDNAEGEEEGGTQMTPTPSPPPLMSLSLPVLPPPNREFSSINNLLSVIEEDKSEILANVLRNHVYVGCVDRDHSVVQYKTKLLLFQHTALLRELFRQLAIKKFKQQDSLKLTKPVAIQRFIRYAIDSPISGWEEEDGDKDNIAKDATQWLVRWGDMLYEYFGIGVSSNGFLTHLPDLLSGFSPNHAMLPLFLMRLAIEVNYEDETACFANIARELSYLFAHLPTSENENNNDENNNENALKKKQLSKVRVLAEASSRDLENLLYPACRAYLVPPQSLNENGVLVQIAATEDLYKVFERC